MKNGKLKARADALLGAGRFRDAILPILSILKSEPGCAPAYEKLGVAQLRLKNYPAAITSFKQALRLMPENANVCDGLAETYGWTGDLALNRQLGLRSLQLKDSQARKTPPKHALMERRSAGSKLIAFSLFGAKPRYCEMSVLNVLAARQHFPGWICRFYVDATVPPDILERLRAAGAEIVMMSGARLQIPGTMWRFLALDDPQAAIVIVRDVDALIGERDQQCVAEWLDDGSAFHVIRDYFTHSELILAGLFGTYAGILGDVEALMQEFLARQKKIIRVTDQDFLRTCIWPQVFDQTFSSDMAFGFGSRLSQRMLPCADPYQHVGANLGGCAMMEIAVAAKTGSAIRWTLIDRNETQVCTYESTVAADGKIVVDIPRVYASSIRTGEYRIEHTYLASVVSG
ncbi:MAG: tetratricopeptide repeat protein [Collimonas sp.]|uniref:tetratricopeptide repeat protein n=1 Tax=Collimonas sp. TaxID=1963772 RepID=UPI0032669EDC